MNHHKLAMLLALFSLTCCESSRTLYTSSDTKANSWKINAYTMSHCGCTQLFAEKYRNGKNEFQVMYTDDFARKNIYRYNDKGMISDTTVFVASTGAFQIPFDSLDHEIFRRMKGIIEGNGELAYKMKWTEYKGYTE